MPLVWDTLRDRSAIKPQDSPVYQGAPTASMFCLFPVFFFLACSTFILASQTTTTNNSALIQHQPQSAPGTAAFMTSNGTLSERDGDSSNTLSSAVIIQIVVMTAFFIAVHVALALVWVKCRTRRDRQLPQRSNGHPDAQVSLSVRVVPSRTGSVHTRMSGETAVARLSTSQVTVGDNGPKDVEDGAIEMSPAPFSVPPAPIARPH
ncbi:hypothetical protein C8J57DRAFT_354650 [Mycena rebaudengoi]|nr:hypothetical protein C8J57DRAFT_354650 [Mycena rebaudengoi]